MRTRVLSSCSADALIRWTTTLSVVLVAGIAAVVSYRHMYELALRHGESSLGAMLIQLAVDGMIVASSMSILLASRYGRRGGALAWVLLVIGSLASLGANVAVADPTLIARVIAAWPSFALIGAYEMLMSQIRRSAGQRAQGHYVVKGAGDASMVGTRSGEGGQPDDLLDEDGVPADRNSGGRVLQRAAWRWALEHHGPDGDLPSGVKIARAFSRSPRRGRLVKNAGLAGELADAPGTGSESKGLLDVVGRLPVNGRQQPA
jgi:hypothetical protein